jgi:hypothetical protein
MKVVITTLTAAVLSFGLATSAPAAEKKAKKEAAAPAAEAKKSDAKPASEAKAGRPLPMNARVDSIDASAKSFTMKRRDGVEVKHVVAASAEIKNNGADAKFADIKVGDYVAGLRNKKSDTEYEVVKITKFGPAAPKKAKGDVAAKVEDKKKE